MAKSKAAKRFSYSLGDEGRMVLSKSSHGGLFKLSDVARLVRTVRGYMAQQVSEAVLNSELARFPKTKEFQHEP